MKNESGKPLPQSVLRAVERFALEAQSDLHRLDSRFSEQFADTGSLQSQLALLEAYCIRRFDLLAESKLYTSASPNFAAIYPLYGKYLDREIQERALPFLSEVIEPLPSDQRDELVSRIELKLNARKLWWLAEAKTRRLGQQTVNESANNSRNTKSRKHPRPASALPPKSCDLSEMFSQAELAPRQAEIASLAWERGLKKAQIARHLGLNWTTVDESLAGAKRRVDKANLKSKLAARMARQDPEKHGR